MWQRIKNIYHLGNAFLANLWFGFPSKGLIVIGVTGTDGKTTTVSLIYHILHTAGYNASMISSVGAVIGGKEYDVGFHVTTPSPWALQRFINDSRHSGEDSERMRRGRLQNLSADSMVQGDSGRALLRRGSGSLARMTMHKASYLVLEVTSHALDQYRVWGIKFDVGVLTNVTHEHLDYHKTYGNYVKTKAKLLKMSRVAIVNRDDESYQMLSSKFKVQSSKLRTYGMGRNADVNPQTFPFKTNMIGEFNKYNVLAAVAACRNLGIEDETIREAILTFKPPIGREEIVYPSTSFGSAQDRSSGQANFMVMIDFAHTPNAFEQILSSIRPNIKGKLIHVFGSAGERDSSKRPLMGKASASYSDVIVLTAEDPRSESVEKIMNEIELGIMNYELRIKKKTLLKIPNRQEAIETAISIAKRGDFVLITGKGHEKSMNYGKGEEPWDEFEAVKEAISSKVKY